jgi:hypothetical protein
MPVGDVTPREAQVGQIRLQRNPVIDIVDAVVDLT